ncbi:MAG: WG repeat-containing protein [Saprospiraceae bacterium]
MVATMGGKSGLIDVSGKKITPLKINYMYPVENDLFIAETGVSQQILIDHTGKQVLPDTYSTLFRGLGDYYLAARDSLMGIIDLSGKEIIPFSYYSLREVRGKLVVYDKEGKAGVIDMKNNVVLPVQFDNIDVLADNRFLVDKDNKRGLMDASGKWILTPAFDITYIGGDYHEGMDVLNRPQHCLLLFKGGEGKLYNLDGKLLSDKKWLYGGIADENGFTMMTDCNGRESMIAPDGTIFAKDPELKKVTVRTAQELCNAIGNDVEITLEDGQYDLGAITDTTQFATIFDYGFEDRTMLIRNVRNLHIKAKNAGKAEIVVKFSFVPVIKLDYCQNISFTGITMGHDINPGHCDGAVISADGCTYLAINECDLYGSGTYGLEAYSSSYTHLNKTTIRECTRGIVWLQNTGDTYFNDCLLRDNTGADMVNLHAAYNVVFKGVRFENNIVPDEWGPYDFFHFESMYQPLILDKCVFDNCAADYYVTDISMLEETDTKREGMTIKKAVSRDITQ